MRRTVFTRCLLPLAGLALASSPALAREPAESAGAVFERVKDNPAALRIFVQALPKGGDLHNHLSGTPYAEDYIEWGAEEGMCMSADGTAIVAAPCVEGHELAGLSLRNPDAYTKLINELSTRGWQAGIGADERSGHTQFFATFSRFDPIVAIKAAESIAATRRNAAAGNVHYLEVMFYPRVLGRSALGVAPAELGPEDFEATFASIEAELPDLLAQTVSELDATEASVSEQLGCTTDWPEPACAVTTRYATYVLREFAPSQAFRQMALGLALAEHDPRFLSVNIVQPEDGPRALADYDLHMEMYAFLGARFPDVKLTLHAGELALGQVPILDMKDHMTKAIAIAGADRIGHGTGIAYETEAPAVLRHMAENDIAVEINLTSNDVILGVSGDEHPLRLYMDAGVPVMLSTDDEGVLRSDISHEYLRAVTEHGLTYAELKHISRASLEYAFLPGESLWQSPALDQMAGGCSLRDASEQCDSLLASSEKAREQMRLERAFEEFETEVLEWTF